MQPPGPYGQQPGPPYPPQPGYPPQPPQQVIYVQTPPPPPRSKAVSYGIPTIVLIILGPIILVVALCVAMVLVGGIGSVLRPDPAPSVSVPFSPTP